ncbi:phosphoribosylglycinamide formyltransferase [Thermocrispum municipale]|uniref:phosphoribosylglycinamide formyltransferase n=1 Tax=Thermocrispum municipale TaxID=37926 RepID=UPI0004293775|nr:phosphoribosylglycinamide formyltransferase [Thermocrispum municipale]
MIRLELPNPARLVVLASGSGTLLQSLIDATASPDYPADIVAVGSDRPQAQALHRARAAGIPDFVVRLADHPDRAAWDTALTEAVAAYRPDLVVSAGFMKLLGPRFLEKYDSRVVNSHPALLPSFPGMHAVRDALAAGVSVTGTTVHFVDAGVDSGPIIARRSVEVLPTDDEESLHERIKVIERTLLVDVVSTLVRHGCTIVDGRVEIS